MENPQEIIREIIRSIHDASRLYTSPTATLPPNVAGMYDQLSDLWKPLQTPQQLDGIMKGTNWDLSATGSFLYLEPLENMRAIPIMTFQFDFSTSIPEVRLQLLLFLRDSDDEIVSVGYRFETPEGEGKHDFYHVQPIKTVRTQGQDRPHEGPDWVPDDYPTFPVDADDPVGLLISLLVSLYNLDYLARVYPLHYELRDHVRNKMHLLKSKRNYWEVTVKGVESFSCCTAFDKNELKKKLEKDYKAQLRHAVKVGLTESNYSQYKIAGKQRTI